MYYYFFFFFFNDTATTEIYTLSLHDALPIFTRKREALRAGQVLQGRQGGVVVRALQGDGAQLLPDDCGRGVDRKSTRLNSSHSQISYAVFCLKKKKKYNRTHRTTETVDKH